jgi:MoaA/NifB/PqqE/SkfB family radical SAM enzyme
MYQRMKLKTESSRAANGLEANGRDVARASKAFTLVPGVCEVSVTNVCNATCSFCSFAWDKHLVKDKRWLDRAEFRRALPILYRRGIRYLNFQGGEPLLHPEIDGIVADTRAAGFHPALVTNGWMLPQKIESLVAAGLGTLLVSIDSHSLEDHERNRGLEGVSQRIRHGLSVARSNGLATLASVTVNRLVNYEALPEFLRFLGVEAVTFSYPRRKPMGSSSMVFSESSRLVDFAPEELVEILESIRKLKKRFPVLNPTASIENIKHHVRGEHEEFACEGGHKYFYLDWNLTIWRCEAWGKPLGSVFDFDKMPDCRDRCTACMVSCYRDGSVLMHAGVAFEDALAAMRAGRLGEAGRLVFRRSVGRSLVSVMAEARQILHLARRSKKQRAVPIHVPETPQTAALNPGSFPSKL